MSDTLTVKEACKYSGLALITIRRYVEQNKVDSELRDGLRYITQASLDRVLQGREERKKPTPKPLSIPDLLPIEEQPTLDGALENMKSSIFKVSQYLTKKAEALQPGEYDFPVLTLAMQKMTDSLTKLVQLAPFLSFRYNFESVQKFKTWVSENPDISPERKREALEMASKYQESAIKKVETIDGKDYQIPCWVCSECA